MNADRFLVEVVRPVLREMDMWSWAAEKLLIMTACHESGGFRYRKQVNGPAVSFFQIEPRTFEDIWNRYLMARSDRFAKVVQFLPVGATARYALEHDDKFACAVARMKYAAVPDPLPDVTDDEGLARYCKDHWNTKFGKATPEKYLNDFREHGPRNVPECWLKPETREGD